MITVTHKDKPLTTPRGRLIAVPTALLAAAIAMEGDKKQKPLTHLASIAIDLVTPQRAQVMEDILVYAHTDVVCYRAENNAPLLLRERASLDPIVAWANKRFSFTLTITYGVMPVKQPENVVAKLEQAFESYTPWQLAALAVATKSLGSIMLASALIEGTVSADEAYACATLEDTFETEHWGKDDEKEARLEQLNRELRAVKEFIGLLQ